MRGSILFAPSKKQGHGKIRDPVFSLGRYGLAPLVCALAQTIGFDRSQSCGIHETNSRSKPGFKVPRAAGSASADAHKLAAKPGLKVPSLAPSPPYGMVDAMVPYGVFIFGDRVSVFLSRNPFVYML